MSRVFKSLLTVAGREKIAAAIINGDKVIFSHMSVGDGGGSPTVPSDEQTRLINETFRTQLNSLKLSDTENIIVAEMNIPPEIGGFSIREAALFDEAGICMAVANVPETYKPELTEGSGRFTIIRIMLAVSSTESVELIADPGVVLATVEDLIQTGNDAKDHAENVVSEHAESRNHPEATLSEKGFTRLSNELDSEDQTRAATPLAIKLAIAQAIRSAWEMENPVGTVRLYSQNVNPNEIYPWSTWVYTGENKSIRIARADGSNVGQTAGSDTATIQKKHLPAEQITVSGTAESVNLGEKQTKPAGAASFTVYRFGADGRENSKGNFSLDDVAMGDVPVPVSIPDHTHPIDLGSHEHPVSGKTANLGEGQALSIVEAHTLLMCWARTA